MGNDITGSSPSISSELQRRRYHPRPILLVSKRGREERLLGSLFRKSWMPFAVRVQCGAAAGDKAGAEVSLFASAADTPSCKSSVFATWPSPGLTSPAAACRAMARSGALVD